MADPRRNGGKGRLEFLDKGPPTAYKFMNLVGEDGDSAVRNDAWTHHRDVRGPWGAEPAARDLQSWVAGPDKTHQHALSFMRAHAGVVEYEEHRGNMASLGSKGSWRGEDVSPPGQGYHRDTNAETNDLIGEAMGHAMKKLYQRTS